MTEARPRKQVNIYTDGACSGNPGPGGWGCILEFGPHRKEMSGYMAGTTNNRMELFAAISALGALPSTPCGGIAPMLIDFVVAEGIASAEATKGQ